MHRKKIIHRDIKPDNILLNSLNLEQIDVRIADLGFAIEFEENKEYIRCGTPCYIAPEVLLGLPFNYKVDIFSIGSVIYKLLSLNPLIRGKSVIEIMRKTVNQDFD